MSHAIDDPHWKATGRRIKHSVCLWPFQRSPIGMDVATLARHAAAMGIQAMDLVEAKDWRTLKQHGLVCSLACSHPLEVGLNHVENHPECLAKLRQVIEDCAAAGFPNVVTFSGNRRGISDEEGMANTVAALKHVIGQAEQRKVTLCLEVLNSRVAGENLGHPDYQCDRVEWGVEVCRRVGSSRMKILFDIYHVQIMQGDVIARIREFAPFIGHYHTAGVPGRNEIDGAQELNYRPIIEAIAVTGFQGYVAQEFMPAGPDPVRSLRQAVQICDV